MTGYRRTLNQGTEPALRLRRCRGLLVLSYGD